MSLIVGVVFECVCLYMAEVEYAEEEYERSEVFESSIDGFG